MISKLIIDNFRSIRNLDIELGQYNAFIGPNSSGKSNILKALNLVLGTTYPSIRSFDDCDFYRYDQSLPIHIEVRFSNTFTFSNNSIKGFRIDFDCHDFNYYAVDPQGNIATYFSGGREIKVSTAMREAIPMMYLPLDRQAYQQIRPTQWTVYGKLLRHIGNQITSAVKEQFTSNVEDSYNQGINPYVQDVENRLNRYVEEQTGLNLRLKLSIIDPTMILKDIE